MTADNTNAGTDWGNNDPSVFELKVTKEMHGEFQVTNGYGSSAAKVMNVRQIRTRKKCKCA